MDITFTTNIKAKIDYDQQVNMFVAYVPALKIYSQGETQGEAEIAIKDAVESYLVVAHEKLGNTVT